jgi:hypothetical protein
MKWRLTEQYKGSRKQSLIFEKVSNIEKPLAKLTKTKRLKIKINKIRDEWGDVTIGTIELQLIMEYFEKLHYNKLEISDEMDTFLDTYELPKLNQEDINNLNRSITSNEIESVRKKSLERIGNTLEHIGIGDNYMNRTPVA